MKYKCPQLSLLIIAPFLETNKIGQEEPKPPPPVFLPPDSFFPSIARECKRRRKRGKKEMKRKTPSPNVAIFYYPML